MSDVAPNTLPKAKKSVALSGTPAGNTALCTVGRSGNDLHYRGYDIHDLATRRHLRGSGAPAGARRAARRSQLTAYRTKLQAPARAAGASSARRWNWCRPVAHPMDVMRTGCSVLGTVLPERDGHPARRGARHRRPADGQLRLDAAVLVALHPQRPPHRRRDRRRHRSPRISCTCCTASRRAQSHAARWTSR